MTKRRTPAQRLRVAVRATLEKAEEEYSLYHRGRGIRYRVLLTQAEFEELERLAAEKETRQA